MMHRITDQINFFKLILNHPLTRKRRTNTLLNWLFWKIGSRLVPGDVLVPYVNNTLLLVRPGMKGATLNIYVGLAEFNDMSFISHVLRPDDIFYDIGANIGVYTILASGVCGATSVSIEPIQSTFERLKQNVRLNKLDELVKLIHGAVGQEKGFIKMTTDLDTTNHAVSESEDNLQFACEVPVFTIDAIAGNSIPQCIKIDVEGFEANVLKGAKETLSSENLMAVIMELNGSGKRYGISDEHIHKTMLANDFSTFEYNPFTRELINLNRSMNPNNGNTLYIKNDAVGKIKERVKTASSFIVKQIKI